MKSLTHKGLAHKSLAQKIRGSFDLIGLLGGAALFIVFIAMMALH